MEWRYSIELFDSIEFLVFTLGDEVSCYAEIDRNGENINILKIVHMNDDKIEYSVEEAILGYTSK
ncbi:MAG: hypothetical protein U9Q80_11060 [Bacillota bacterium]|nr:hypothetical protein [Bacillota bacterium]